MSTAGERVQVDTTVTVTSVRAETPFRRIANEFFSYQVLEDELNLMISRPQNIYRLLGRLKRFRGKDLS